MSWEKLSSNAFSWFWSRLMSRPKRLHLALTLSARLNLSSWPLWVLHLKSNKWFRVRTMAVIQKGELFKLMMML